jgi:hypothetical protein
MSTSFADNFEQPVTITVDGKELAVRPLTTRDYLPWLDELTEQKRKREIEHAPPPAKPIDRFKVIRSILAEEVTPDDLVPLIFTAKGTIRIGGMALRKAGMEESRADAWMDSQSAKANEEFAARVSGLLSQQRLADLYGSPTSTDATTGGGAQNPNQQAAPGQLPVAA